MWHLKTKSGIFWVMKADNVASSEKDEAFLFGIDDCKLGVYQNLAQVALDVCEQTTGYLDWDCQSRIRAPADISQWKQGPPDGW